MEHESGVFEVSCEEYGHVDVDPALLLAPDGRLRINDDIMNRDAYRVSFAKGKLRFTASSMVGVIPLNDNVILRVRPRVPVSNLTKMVLDTGHPVVALQAFRSYRGHGTAPEWLLDRYAEALIAQIDQILDKGLYRQYVRREGSGSFPRGRIDFQRTVASFASRGVPNKAAYSWHERTVDNPPNRCLKAALRVIHAHLSRGKFEKGYGSLLAALVTQFRALETVEDDPALRFLEDPEVLGVRPLPDPRFYYRSALDIALLVVRGQGVALELEGADVRVQSLLVDMNDLFESYCRIMLLREASARQWPVMVLDQQGRVPLYETPGELPRRDGEPLPPIGPGTSAEATPDIVFRMPDGTVPLVAECKNTAKGGVLPDRSEVNQAVTYAVRYRLNKALVVRPRKYGQAGLWYAGQVGSVAVYEYSVDLGSEDLAGVQRDFADAVSYLMPTAATEAQTPPPTTG